MCGSASGTATVTVSCVCAFVPSLSGVSPEEKAHVRAKLSSLIPQEDNQVRWAEPGEAAVAAAAGTWMLLTRLPPHCACSGLPHDLMQRTVSWAWTLRLGWCHLRVLLRTPEARGHGVWVLLSPGMLARWYLRSEAFSAAQMPLSRCIQFFTNASWT
eukprot:365452-Chlamydomonas_euryale.AAC.6